MGEMYGQRRSALEENIYQIVGNQTFTLIERTTHLILKFINIYTVLG